MGGQKPARDPTGRPTAPRPEVPVNTNGGGLSYMHSGIYGMHALQESVRQMRGIAPAQVERAKISLVVSAACSPQAARSLCPTTRLEPDAAG